MTPPHQTPDRSALAHDPAALLLGPHDGYRKQGGAAYGYSGVNGLNAQLAVVSTPLAAPVIAAARRRGNAVSGEGAAKLLAGALASARSAGVSGRVLVRADSAYYRHDLIHAAIRAGAWFSVAARQNAKV